MTNGMALLEVYGRQDLWVGYVMITVPGEAKCPPNMMTCVPYDLTQ
jgi:hypothetical protein